MVWRSTVDENDLRRTYKIANRLEADERIIADLPKIRINDKRIRRHQQGVAVGCSVRYVFGSDRSVRQQAGVDLKHRAVRPAERLAHLICKQMSDNIGGAARRHCDDNPDCPFCLRPSAMDGEKDGRKGSRDTRCYMQKAAARKSHGAPPFGPEKPQGRGRVSRTRISLLS